MKAKTKDAIVFASIWTLYAISAVITLLLWWYVIQHADEIGPGPHHREWLFGFIMLFGCFGGLGLVVFTIVWLFATDLDNGELFCAWFGIPMLPGLIVVAVAVSPIALIWFVVTQNRWAKMRREQRRWAGVQ